MRNLLEKNLEVLTRMPTALSATKVVGSRLRACADYDTQVSGKFARDSS